MENTDIKKDIRKMYEERSYDVEIDIKNNEVSNKDLLTIEAAYRIYNKKYEELREKINALENEIYELENNEYHVFRRLFNMSRAIRNDRKNILQNERIMRGY